MQYLEYLEAIRDYAQEIAPEDFPFDIKLMELALNLEKEIREKYISNDDPRYVMLPVDREGEIYTGNEARYVRIYSDHQTFQICDGLLYNGKDLETGEPRWLVFTQSATGSNWTGWSPENSRHVKPGDDSYNGVFIEDLESEDSNE